MPQNFPAFMRPFRFAACIPAQRSGNLAKNVGAFQVIVALLDRVEPHAAKRARLTDLFPLLDLLPVVSLIFLLAYRIAYSAVHNAQRDSHAGESTENARHSKEQQRFCFTKQKNHFII